MDFNFLNSIFSATLAIKIATLIAIAFYAVFSFVVFTQIKVMSEIIHIPYSSGIPRMISIIQIILAISLFIFAIVIL